MPNDDIQIQSRPAFHHGLSQPEITQVKPRFLMRSDTSSLNNVITTTQL